MKVVPLKEGQITYQRDPNPEVIRVLEDLLNQAQSGEIIGFTGAVVYYDAAAGRARAGKVSYSSIGALFAALQAATGEILDGGK